uniref:Uncharacterized protein n=1 Tax=Equus asinus asinus TaxID=83772 RepID=A0A8C4N8V5_EQUAS
IQCFEFSSFSRGSLSNLIILSNKTWFYVRLFVPGPVTARCGYFTNQVGDFEGIVNLFTPAAFLCVK